MFDDKENNSFRNPPTNPLEAKVVGCKKLNFRRTADKSSANVIDTIPEGTIITVLDKGYGDWSNVSYKGQNGYVMSQFLEDVV